MNRTLVLLALSAVNAATHAEELRTGWLSDTKGATDPETGVRVILVSNMLESNDAVGNRIWRVRYVGLQAPIGGLNPKTVKVFDVDGKPIKHEYPEVHESSQDGRKESLIKLFLERPAGFKFRLEIGP